MKKEKKPFRETRFGLWLKEHDSEVFEFVAARIPANKPIGKFAKLIFLLLADLTDDKKAEAESLIDLD